MSNMLDDKDWIYAEGAMLQDHSDLLRDLAADLRSAADELEFKANELEDQAHCCRKRHFEQSQSSAESPPKRPDAQQIDRQVKNSAASVASARVIRDAVKSIHSVTDEESCAGLRAKSSKVQQATASTQVGTLSMITDRFAERLVQESKRRAAHSAKPPSLHQKYVNADGRPVYASQEGCEVGFRTKIGWTAINPRSNKNPTTVKSAAYVQPLEADEATDAGLLQHVTGDKGVQRSIILRAANRLA